MTKEKAFQNSVAIVATFETNYKVLLMNIDGLSNDDSLIGLEPGGNSLNWVLGHILATRNGILKFMRSETFWNEKEEAIYKQGSANVTKDSNYIELGKLVESLELSQSTLIKSISELNDQALKKGIDEKGTTISEKLAFLAWHEAYHVGQTAIHRRIAGEDGAIK